MINIPRILLSILSGICLSGSAFTSSFVLSKPIRSSLPRETMTTTATAMTKATASGETLHPPQPFPEDALYHDSYEGVTLHTAKLKLKLKLPSTDETHMDDDDDVDVDSFGRMLEGWLEVWEGEGKRGIWVKLPTEHAALVPVCVDMGFEFQHAHKGLLVLTKWLPRNCESRLPNGPSHQVGIGALILHPLTGKMLVVQEKSGPASVHKLWKMPTGLTDPGEDIPTTAVREVREETGLSATFDRIVCIRQAHGFGAFDHSDMFFVCHLVLDSKYESVGGSGGDGEGRGSRWEIPLVPQEEEIGEIKWMEMEEYCGQDLWSDSPLYREINDAMRRVKAEVFDGKRVASVGNGNDQQNNGGNDNGDGEIRDRSLYEGLICKTLPLGYRDGSAAVYVSKL